MNHDKNINLPHFVYRCYNDNASGDERLVYVGCTVNVERRMVQHGTAGWRHLVTRVEWNQYPDKRSGLDAEAATIRRRRPLYNVQKNTRRVFAPPPEATPEDAPLTFQQAAGVSGFHITSIALSVHRGWLKSDDGIHVTYADIVQWVDAMPTWDPATGEVSA